MNHPEDSPSRAREHEPASRIREQIEAGQVAREDDGEVAAIESGNRAPALGSADGSNHRQYREETGLKMDTLCCWDPCPGYSNLISRSVKATSARARLPNR